MKLQTLSIFLVETVVLLALVLLFTPSAFGKRKDDVVIMKNGDKFTGETEPVLNNAEVLLGLKFSTFRFKTLNVTSETFLFLSLTDRGRVRLSSRANLRIELLRNFYWNFQFYENYDSHLPRSSA